MFTYNNLQIISSAPIGDIECYLCELGAQNSADGVYALGNIKITVTPCEPGTFASFAVLRHEISVIGIQADAERFLTNFRFRFLCLGG